jgi:segregation and condensation protein A
LRLPPKLELGHVARPRVSLESRLDHMRSLLSRRGSFTFDEAVKGADRLTECVTLFALLELHKAGEASWSQSEAFGPILVVRPEAELDVSTRGRMPRGDPVGE